MLNFFVKDLGVDLGTSYTLIGVKGKGIVLNEPSVIAVDTLFGNTIAIGKDAKAMLGRTPENIETIKPLKSGVIADFTATKKMLKSFVDKCCRDYLVGRPRVVVGIPLGVTEVESSAVEEAFLEAGAREVLLIEEPMAAAIGAGLKISEASGSMIVDIGSGTSEMAVISMGGIVSSKSIRSGCDDLNTSIINYIKHEFNIMIGESTAEEIKNTIGSAYDSMTIETLNVKGRDLQSGLPSLVTINSKDVQIAMNDVIDRIISCIKIAIEGAPTELAADIMINGITICGGGALIKNIDRLISLETGIPVNIAENPLECVARGTLTVLEDINSLRSVLVNSKRKI